MAVRSTVLLRSALSLCGFLLTYVHQVVTKSRAKLKGITLSATPRNLNTLSFGEVKEEK